MNKLRKLITISAALMVASSMWADGRRLTCSFDIGRLTESETATVCTPNAVFFRQVYQIDGKDNIVSALKSGKLTLQATYFLSSGKEAFYKGKTSDDNFGHWFAASGLATTKEASKAIQVQFDGRDFLVTHNMENVKAGDEFEVKESFIGKAGTDTITYVFKVKIGDEEYCKANQPAVAFGRKNYTDDWLVSPQVRCNEQDWKQQNFVQVNAGESLTLSATLDPKVGTSAKYSWLDGSGKTLTSFKNTADFVISNATVHDGGMYTLKARITKAEGGMAIKTYNYFVDVQDRAGEFYDWPANTPTVSYNFKDDYPDFEAPQKVHKFYQKNGKPANVYAGEWWSVHWGDDLNPMVGMDSATVYQTAKNMVDYFENEFAFIRDIMGWPPDLNARNGYKSYIYIFGSGLSYDSSDSLEMGGYQGWYDVDGFGCPCVTCSFLPFSRFRSDADAIWGYGDSEWQRSAMIHEGIHAILATMKGVKGSAWFHEAGNTWLQGKMAQIRGEMSGAEEDPNAQAGWLDGGPFLAPFMPIECYSGWLQDGSFGGPGAEGVNRYDENGQICTWRRYLGGTQYGNSFPYVLSSFCGNGVVPWIWNNCDGRVLEGIGNYVGDEAMRKVILQYRSRMAIYDFSGAKPYRNTMNANFLSVIGPEYEPYWIKCADWAMTPYANPVLNDGHGWLAPDTLTNPGWSGANFIPIHVDMTQERAEVEFRPEDTNMMAQLCYMTKDGRSFYSQPVHCGTMSIDLSEKPANGVIICVVANTDYIYTGEEQRCHHWDYRIRLKDGCRGVASNTKRWFYYEQDITDPEFETGISEVEMDAPVSVLNSKEGIFDLSGRKVANPTKGLYIINGKKVMVK